MKSLKSIIFISVLSLFCVMLLTFFYQKSKPLIAENEKMDVVKNVLYSFNISFDEEMTKEKVKAIFDQNVKEEQIQGMSYFINEQSGDKKYCFPILAKGLWGLIYGFISLNSDLRTVFRVTFNKHQETPGLGALIDEPDYKDKYKNISLYDKKGSFGIISTKGGGSKLVNSVDSITGATISSEGVVKGINDTVKNYLKALGKYRGRN